MLALISPAKSLDLEPIEQTSFTIPEFKSKASSLVGVLRKFKTEELQHFMEISPALALENKRRFKAFRREHTIQNSKQAVYTFSGDVYRGLDVSGWSEDDIAYAQDHLRILSGLYGVLRPLDLIQPYRLEMGRRLETSKGKNLYQFWDGQVTRTINRLIREKNHSHVINLASAEYSKVVRFDKIKVPVVEVNFKEYKNGALKFLSFNAKKARGMMSRYLVQNRIKTIEGLKAFNLEDYAFDEELSSEDKILFVR